MGDTTLTNYEVIQVFITGPMSAESMSQTELKERLEQLKGTLEMIITLQACTNQSFEEDFLRLVGEFKRCERDLSLIRLDGCKKHLISLRSRLKSEVFE